MRAVRSCGTRSSTSVAARSAGWSKAGKAGPLARARRSSEAALDFSDEDDVRRASGRLFCRGTWPRLAGEIDSYLARPLGGVRLRDGLRVVIAGRRANGKSSLLNALIGRDAAAITPEIAGHDPGSGRGADGNRRRTVPAGRHGRAARRRRRDRGRSVSRAPIRRSLAAADADPCWLGDPSRPHRIPAGPSWFMPKSDIGPPRTGRSDTAGVGENRGRASTSSSELLIRADPTSLLPVEGEVSPQRPSSGGAWRLP